MNSCEQYLHDTAKTVRLCVACSTPLAPFDLRHCPPCGKAAGGVFMVTTDRQRFAWWVR